MLRLYVAFALCISCGYGAVDFDFQTTPCSIKDTECIVGLWQNAVGSLADGRPDLDIPALDPLQLDNIFVDVPGLVSLSFNGILNGFKGCIFDKARTTLKRGHFKEALDLHCNITIKGRYLLQANSSALFGRDGLLQADGEGKVKLDNLFFKFLMDFLIVKDGDRTLKFVLKDGPMGYKYLINGPVVFEGNNITLGGQDISPLVISFVNQNWKFVLDTFGEPFFKRAMEIVADFERAFFTHVTASSYFKENLDDYAIKY